MGLEISKHWTVELSFAKTHWRKTVFWNALEQMARFSGRQCAWWDKERRIHQSRNYYTVKKLLRLWLDAYLENQRNKSTACSCLKLLPNDPTSKVFKCMGLICANTAEAALAKLCRVQVEEVPRSGL
eukprot:TRINITY_DN9878_c0_g1_i1.p1 TRINITY_DN9878_c0_g1~~TRINITY_DN9878_c0_g1_i1.p1  ORF type:complete len:127 (+),score=7.28 TRINITY_DN9878_c0_g1_i1:102-482(+)